MGGVYNLSLLSYKLGNCVVCGERIYSDHQYVKSSDGYCCNNCLKQDEYAVTA